MIELQPIGTIRSTLRALADAPRQGDEGAPDAACALRYPVGGTGV